MTTPLVMFDCNGLPPLKFFKSIGRFGGFLRQLDFVAARWFVAARGKEWGELMSAGLRSDLKLEAKERADD